MALLEMRSANVTSADELHHGMSISL